MKIIRFKVKRNSYMNFSIGEEIYFKYTEKLIDLLIFNQIEYKVSDNTNFIDLYLIVDKNFVV